MSSHDCVSRWSLFGCEKSGHRAGRVGLGRQALPMEGTRVGFSQVLLELGIRKMGHQKWRMIVSKI